ENIAAAGGYLATPAATVKMWMGSPGHRANILDPAFRDTGIGVAPAAPALLTTGPGASYTEDFATTS
ncbi:MAG: CAP domain-containing protein, partial [Actinobacteria bacterium]|nr:CAP domain-containing protein [Actinomycetota bacterium]